MGTIDIDIIGLIIVYSLMILPVLIFIFYRIRLLKTTIISVTRMTVQLALVGLYLKYLFDLNSLWLNILWICIMIIIANSNVLSNTGLNKKKFFFLTLSGIAFSTVFTVVIFVFLAVRPQPFYDARYLIPIAGIILGNCLRGNIISLERFYSSIKKNEKEYNTYLQLGATLHEAYGPYFRQALTAAIAPSLSTMATIGLVSLPGMMTGQILGGSSPMVAIKYQIAVMTAIICSTTLSAFLNITLSVNSAFNEYHVLKPDVFEPSKG
jgi:putative ABC transport system permease protein